MIGLPLVVFASKLLIALPVVRDNLLRHVVSFWSNSYAILAAVASALKLFAAE